MTRLLLGALLLLGVAIGLAEGAQPVAAPVEFAPAPKAVVDATKLPTINQLIAAGQKKATDFKRGAKPTPRHVLVKAKQHAAAPAPLSFAVIPAKLSTWLNDQTGDCVTAEEAFAKAVWSMMAGGPELFVPDSEVSRWAQKYGFYNGALLTDVMDQMAKDGFQVNGSTYGDGPYATVDWTTPTTLQSAISQGPVKIGVASSQFDNVPGVGQANGWFMTKFTPANPNDEDHCVGLCGYGTIAQCFAFLGLPVPAGVDGTKPGWLLFTWSTIGVIDDASLKAITFEAWLRSPTTIAGSGPGPGPGPVIPTPCQAYWHWSGRPHVRCDPPAGMGAQFTPPCGPIRKLLGRCPAPTPGPLPPFFAAPEQSLFTPFGGRLRLGGRSACGVGGCN